MKASSVRGEKVELKVGWAGGGIHLMGSFGHRFSVSGLLAIHRIILNLNGRRLEAAPSTSKGL